MNVVGLRLAHLAINDNDDTALALMGAALQQGVGQQVECLTGHAAHSHAHTIQLRAIVVAMDAQVQAVGQQ